MITIIATQRVKEGKESALEALMQGLTDEIRDNEPGCLRFEHLRSQDDPRAYVVLEQYATQAALDLHKGTAYLQAFLPRLLELLEQPPGVTVLGDVASERPLRRAPIPSTFFHCGVVVRDLDEAMARYSKLLGVTFTEKATFHVPRFEDPEGHPFDVVAVFSREGPPYYELIQASGTGAFSERFADQILYVGVWEPDVPGRIERLRQAGVELEAVLKGSDGVPFVCLTKPHALFGARIEFVGTGAEAGISHWVETGVFEGEVAK
jgi:quinol monooxygenase YgiN/catechol 2,3-dioxygenase-like lactoylglutathione lyase family enzyme